MLTFVKKDSIKRYNIYIIFFQILGIFYIYIDFIEVSANLIYYHFMIRNFENIDIKEASNVAHLVWGDLYAQERFELQKIIYDYTVEYYDLNRKFSFSIFDDGLKGFLLASLKSDNTNSFMKLEKQTLQLSDERERKLAFDLYNYLDYCGKMVYEIMSDNDLLLGLFVSLQKGCGKMLFDKLVETARQNNIKNIYLWTDTTCNYEYYSKNCFELVKEFESIVNEKTITTLIYKKSVL